METLKTRATTYQEIKAYLETVDINQDERKDLLYRFVKDLKSEGFTVE